MRIDKPAIAVIVAIYNVREYLNKCIESVISQTFTDIEVILVNDGSTDDSGEICEKYAKKDNRIKVIHQQNGGLFSARNKGLKNSTAKYLYFIDGDDWLETNLLEDAYGSAIIGNTDVVLFGHFKEMKLSSGLTNIITTLPPTNNFPDQAAVLSKLPLLFQVGCGFAVWEQLIKADPVKESTLEFPPYKRGTDMGFLLALYGQINSFKSIRKAYYHYNAFNNSKKFDPQLIDTHVNLFEKYLEVFQINRPFNFYTIQLFTLWFAHVIPTNIVGNKSFGCREKIALLRTNFQHKAVAIWIDTFKVGQANGFIAKVLLVSLKSRNAILMYVMTWLKIFLKNRVTVNYKRWFYK